MAVELGRFIAEQLKTLPINHPDRKFIEGMHKATASYLGSGDTAEATVAGNPIKSRGISSGTKFTDLIPIDSQKIRQVRLGKGLSLADLGRLVGMNKGSLSRFENGKFSIGVVSEVADRLQQVLGDDIFIRPTNGSPCSNP